MLVQKAYAHLDPGGAVRPDRKSLQLYLYCLFLFLIHGSDLKLHVILVVRQKLYGGPGLIPVFSGCGYLGDTDLQLTQKEFAALLLLVRSAEKTVSKQEVLMEVWNTNVEDDSRALWTLISRLRRKLNSQESRIEISSKRGDGYTLEQI